MGLDTFAPYGTRSRNRGGNSRPNYAEDKDYDAEMYDVDPERTQSESKKSARQAVAASHGEGARPSANSRKPAAEDAKAPASQNGISKDQNSGGATSLSQATQGSNNAALPSKKRKAATAGQPPSNGTATAVMKRNGNGNGHGPQNSATPWSETNMLTFTNGHGRCQDGHLVADDGTVLEKNGRFPTCLALCSVLCSAPSLRRVALLSAFRRSRSSFLLLRRSRLVQVAIHHPCTRARRRAV